MTDQHWHYERGAERVGPFRLQDLQQLAHVGLIHPDTPLLHPDGSRIPARALLAFAAEEQTQVVVAEVVQAPDPSLVWNSPPPPPPPPPAPAYQGTSLVAIPPYLSPPKPKLPWNPRAIGWLGLAFSPIWAGTMAALNSRRLHTGLPLWRPIAIGIGATILDMLVSAMFGDLFLIDLILYAGALGLIWHLDLKPQVPLFETQQAEPRRSARWFLPSLAGCPTAFFVFLTFIVGPLLPLSPRDVCQRFTAANSLKAAKTYSGTRLWPALEVMFAYKEGTALKIRCDLLDEAEAPPDLGGYFVACRCYGQPKDQVAFLLDGVFHLRNIDGDWKIEDYYVTAVNNQETEGPVSIAADYQTLLPDLPPASTIASSDSATVTPTDAARSGWALTRWLTSSGGGASSSTEARALASGGHVLAEEGKNLREATTKGKALVSTGWKRLLGMLAAIGAGLTALGKAFENFASKSRRASS